MTMKKVWNQLVEDLGKQMIRRTPKGLLKTLSDLDDLDKEQEVVWVWRYYWIHGSIRKTNFPKGFSSDIIFYSGDCAGYGDDGNLYINRLNMTQCIYDN
tara:strand:- start:658 stop:954 length:297 start_codon:yes stop_codon:yes gene_type:complete